MKLTAQKKVTGITSEILATIAHEITDYVSVAERCDCPESWGRCQCDARFVGTAKMLEAGESVSLSYYGESVAVISSENALEVNYQTCGGTHHNITIDLPSGYMVISSDGKRNSHGWGVADLSDTLKKILKKESGKDWELIDVETTQPSWGIWNWLAGKLKDGPTNLNEAQDSADEPDAICFHCNKSFKICEQCGF